jgi:hypothetical protein
MNESKNDGNDTRSRNGHSAAFAVFNNVTGVLVFISLFFSMFIRVGSEFTFFQQLNLAVLNFLFCGFLWGSTS